MSCTLAKHRALKRRPANCLSEGELEWTFQGMQRVNGQEVILDCLACIGGGQSRDGRICEARGAVIEVAGRRLIISANPAVRYAHAISLN